MIKFNRILILLLIVLIVVIPFVLRNKEESVILNDRIETVVILTPNNESLRYEYGHGFKKWYKKQTGKDINVDWRYQGGGQETSRYIESMFSNSFMNYWINVLKRTWSNEHAAAFHVRNATHTGNGNSLAKTLYKAFTDSDVGCGVDLLFGGGVYEFINQANKGNIVECEILKERPDMFTDDTIPEFFAGDRLWDHSGKWFGATLSSFGIIYNEDALLADGILNPPATWEDLASPKYFRKLAVVDPTKSSSVLKAFGMLIQQQMQLSYDSLKAKKHVNVLEKDDELQAVSNGWLSGLKIIQKIAANGRYFTESATKPIIDVSTGNCLAGIAVDFYGFAEAKHLEERCGSTRFKFIMPHGGGAPSPDPIAVFRGANRPDLAKKFIEYIISLDGQKLIDFKIGSPGGPIKTTMRRTPILKTIYTKSEYEQYRVDPSIDPYKSAASFVSHGEWMDPVLSPSGILIRVAFIDNNMELINAWGAILKARSEGKMQAASEAEKIMTDLAEIDYLKVVSELSASLNSKDITIALRTQNTLCDSFRKKYILAKLVASENTGRSRMCRQIKHWQREE